MPQIIDAAEAEPAEAVPPAPPAAPQRQHRSRKHRRSRSARAKRKGLSWQRLWRRSRRWAPRIGLVAALGALIAFFPVDWLRLAIMATFPDRPAFACDIREWAESSLGAKPAQPPGTLTLVVARLHGDADGAATAAVNRTLRGQPGWRLRQACRGLDTEGAEATNRLAQHDVQALLQQRGGDLLLWGEATDARALRFRFVGRGLSPRADAAPFALDRGLLARSPPDVAATALTVVALAAGASADTSRGRQAVASLQQRLPELEALVASPPPGLTVAQRQDLAWAEAQGVQALGEHAADLTALARAAEQWWNLSGTLDQRESPDAWAGAQYNLGTTLAKAGQQGDRTKLEAAVAAFQRASQAWTRDRAPRDWAMTQTSLGTVLATLGDRAGNTVRLAEGVAAYSQALEVYSRERTPQDRAMTQNNLGIALATLGDREGDPAKLESAVVAYREALREWTQDRAPLAWAATQHNLAATLRVLGARARDVPRLEAAAEAYHAALREWTRDRMPDLWAQTMESLAVTGEVLAALGGGVPRLQEALTDAEAALDEYRRAGAEGPIARSEALVGRLRAKLPG